MVTRTARHIPKVPRRFLGPPSVIFHILYFICTLTLLTSCDLLDYDLQDSHSGAATSLRLSRDTLYVFAGDHFELTPVFEPDSVIIKDLYFYTSEDRPAEEDEYVIVDSIAEDEYDYEDDSLSTARGNEIVGISKDGLLALRPGWTKVYAESVSSRLIDSCVVCVMAPWDEAAVDYPTETVIYADVTIQGQPATQETLVAAFVGDELRAFGTFAYRRGTDETCMIFRIRHNPVEPGDPEPGKIELRYYDAPNYDLLRFMPDIAIDGESHGTPSDPVRIAF